MSTGRYTMRGYAFQSRAFATWALANSGEEAPPAAVTTRRLVIVGTSKQRLAICGTSKERLTIEGAGK